VTLSTDISSHLNTERVALQDVRIGSGVRHQLAAIVAELPGDGPVAVLLDEREYLTAAGESVKRTIIAALTAVRPVVQVVLVGDVHADEKTVAEAVAGCADANLVVTVGSGTLCDIGKVAAGARPHVVLQSAASVNGFADDQSVLLINGVKRTTHSGWPHTILIDEDIVEAAPAKLNRSGLGDMISMFTAPADWYLSSLFGMDRGFDANSATMTRRYGDDLLSIAGGVGRSEPAPLATLSEFVTLSGISMGVAGQTSPSSGMEHTVSHLIDMANGSEGQPNAHHGEQVGVATVLVALLWRKIIRQLDEGSIGELVVPDAITAEGAVRAAFDWMDAVGNTSNECWADYSLKRAHLADTDAGARLRAARASWSAHREMLESLLMAPERIVKALREAGAPTRFSQLSEPIAAATVRWALSNCHLMRNRFTIADLAALTGAWTESDVEEIIEEAEALGAGL
jgi:glycerol-1-phosphate dehydrogenase [NAD(P)+]